MTETEILLGVEPPIRELPGDEGADDRTNTASHEHPADIAGREPPVVMQERPQQRQPCTPDCVLEKHHDGQAASKPKSHTW
jgi:hypothetical protein